MHTNTALLEWNYSFKWIHNKYIYTNKKFFKKRSVLRSKFDLSRVFCSFQAGGVFAVSGRSVTLCRPSCCLALAVRDSSTWSSGRRLSPPPTTPWTSMFKVDRPAWNPVTRSVPVWATQGFWAWSHRWQRWPQEVDVSCVTFKEQTQTWTQGGPHFKAKVHQAEVSNIRPAGQNRPCKDPRTTWSLLMKTCLKWWRTDKELHFFHSRL